MSAADIIKPGKEEDAPKGLSLAKWVYTIGFLISAVITFFLRDFSDEWFSKNVKTFKYCQDAKLTNLCSGKQVALRVSFGNFMFFAGHVIILVGLQKAEDPRLGLHTGMWFWKLLLWVGSIVGAFFLPTNSVYTYGEISRFGSGLFLIFQVVELINFIYVINEYLLERDDGVAKTAIVSGSFVSICMAFAMIGVSYHYYTPSKDCSLNIFFITWSVIMGVVMVAVLFIPERASTAGLLTSGAVFAYCSYVLVSALNSEPPTYKCVKNNTQMSSKWIQIVALILALLAICYSTMSTSTSDIFAAAHDDGTPLPYRPDFFHLIFALGSMYMAMLFTNWEISRSASKFQLDKGWKSVWVKMGSKWLCEVVYVWTVVAPALFNDRHFGR